MSPSIEPAAALDPSQILELRQYTLHPGKRDTLIELFDRCFVESQEETGMRVLGQFRDLDAPDRFVWLRGFPDQASRAARLEAFYGGPAWAANREAANTTMIDSDNVLLLRPVDAGTGVVVPRTRSAPAEPGAFVLATVYMLRSPVDDAFLRFFATRIAPVLAAAGAPPLARFRTEYSKNEFPRLPVREGEHAFVWLTSFASAAAHEHHRAELARSTAWTRALEPELSAMCLSQQHLRLAPTARSLLRHVEPVGYTTHRTGDAHDFDFLAGAWNVVNRRLVARGVGSAEWEEFPASHAARLHLGGLANVDEMVCPTKGWSGMTVRHFRIADRQWTIFWISSKTGAIDPGVVGGFEGDRGEFYGEDTDDGKPVKVRFIWTRLGRDAARWEQSFSYSDGPWEINWIMEFTRAA
jgi:quinol monooxygenase YgiN